MTIEEAAEKLNRELWAEGAKVTCNECASDPCRHFMDVVCPILRTFAEGVRAEQRINLDLARRCLRSGHGRDLYCYQCLSAMLSPAKEE